jgi:malate dehydrogenase
MNVNPNDVEATVIGGHGDTTMVPLISLATCKGVPVTTILSKEKLEEIAAATKAGGSTLTGLLGTSAWYAPGAAAAIMAEAIVKDQKPIIPCAVMLEGEYGQSGLAIGVPIVLSSEGWEKIVEFPIDEIEKEAFIASADATRKVNQILIDTGIL